MFRRFAQITAVKNQVNVASTMLGGGAAIGGGTGMYRGYSTSHSMSVSERIVETTKRSIVGAYIGVIYTITLPVTLPIAIGATVWQLTDDDIRDMKYDNLLTQSIMWKQEDMFE